jgi:hypothetical protein
LADLTELNVAIASPSVPPAVASEEIVTHESVTGAMPGVRRDPERSGAPADARCRKHSKPD